MRLLPAIGVFHGEGWGLGIFIEVENVGAQGWGDVGEVVSVEPEEEIGVGLVGESVFAGLGVFAGVEVAVGKFNGTLAGGGQVVPYWVAAAMTLCMYMSSVAGVGILTSRF